MQGQGADSAPASESGQGWLLAVLALIAGYVDAYAFLHYRIYGSFMSGNTTQTGLSAGQGDVSGAAYNFLPIPVFIAGVFAGTLMVHSGLGKRLRLLFSLVAALLVLAILALFVDASVPLSAIVALSLAMGIMNTSVTSVGPENINLGYVSGTLNNLARHLAFAVKGDRLSDAENARDTHARRAALLAGIWTAFVTGALLAGAAFQAFPRASLLAPILVLTGLAAYNPAPRRSRLKPEGGQATG